MWCANINTAQQNLFLKIWGEKLNVQFAKPAFILRFFIIYQEFPEAASQCRMPTIYIKQLRP